MSVLEININENNCCGWDGKKCTSLLNSSLTASEKEECGTLACPFYKPRNLRNGVRLKINGTDIFYSKEEYEEMTGIHILAFEDMDMYDKHYAHASPSDLNSIEADESIKEKWIKERQKKEKALFAAKKTVKEVMPVPKDVKMSVSYDFLKSQLLDIAKKYNLKVNQMSSKAEIYNAIQNG